MKLILLNLICFLLATSAFASNNIIDSLEKFHSDLEERQLAVRHDLEREIIAYLNTGDKHQLKSYMIYLVNNSYNMNINDLSKKIIKNKASELIYKIEEKPKVKKIAVSKPRPRRSEKVQIVSAKEVERKLERLDRVSKVEAAPTKTTVVKNKVTLKSPEAESGILFSWIYIFYTGVILLLMGTFPLIVNRLKSVLHWRRTKVTETTETTQMINHEQVSSVEMGLTYYRDIQIPAILIDSNEIITWSNRNAEKVFGLTVGSSFFIKSETKYRSSTQCHTYTYQSNEYVLQFNTIPSSAEARMICFLPVTTNLFTSRTQTVGSIDLPYFIESTFNKSDYLFTNASIPVVVDNKVSKKLKVDDSLVEIFDKAIKTTYNLSKDLKHTKVNFLMDELDNNKSLLQIEIENMNYSMLSDLEDGLDRANTTQAWKEMELSLAKRNGRVFIFDTEEDAGVTFQLMFDHEPLNVSQFA